MKLKKGVVKRKISKINRGKKIINNIKPKNFNIIANVKSETDPDKIYNISYQEGHLLCDCNKQYTGVNATSCKHLSAIILNILEGFKGETIDNLSKIFDNIQFYNKFFFE